MDNTAAQASTQRCANARVIGNARTPAQTATIAAAAQARCFAPRAAAVRRSLSRDNPRAVSGRHSALQRRDASRSSAHWPVSVLLLSIFLDVLLSKRLLCAAEKSSNGCRVQIESGCQFFVGEAVGAKEQEFRLTRGESGQHKADSFLFLLRRVDFFRRGR